MVATIEVSNTSKEVDPVEITSKDHKQQLYRYRVKPVVGQIFSNDDNGEKCAIYSDDNDANFDSMNSQPRSPFHKADSRKCVSQSLFMPSLIRRWYSSVLKFETYS